MEHPPYWAAEAVAAFLREQSAWRLAQAHRFPSDPRNDRSARALEELALHVEGLPDGDLALQELVDAGAFDAHRRFVATDDARRAVARFGFDWITTPRVLLQELARATWRGRRPSAQKRKDDMTVATASRSKLGELVGAEGPTLSLVDPEAATLEDIFTVAIAHDRRCLQAEDALRARLGITLLGYTEPRAPGAANAEDDLNEYDDARLELCATIARAALRRLDVLAPFNLASRGSILELESRELERFLRPIFVESGIGTRYLVTDPLRAWDPRATERSLDDADAAIDVFLKDPTVEHLEHALVLIEKIGPPHPATTVDWEASKVKLRRTIKAAGQPRGSIYAASIEGPNLLRLFREDLSRSKS
jgi:hypothetical protein